MTKADHVAGIDAIRATVANSIEHADPSELQPYDVILAVYDYTYDALSTDGLPEFGTAEWVVLADDDPRKVRAVVLAALAHLNRQAAVAAAHVETDEDIRTALRERGGAHGPDHVELARRRAVSLEAKPALTAAQIAARTRCSWESFEQQLAGATSTNGTTTVD